MGRMKQIAAKDHSDKNSFKKKKFFQLFCISVVRSSVGVLPLFVFITELDFISVFSIQHSDQMFSMIQNIPNNMMQSFFFVLILFS